MKSIRLVIFASTLCIITGTTAFLAGGRPERAEGAIAATNVPEGRFEQWLATGWQVDAGAQTGAVVEFGIPGIGNAYAPRLVTVTVGNGLVWTGSSFTSHPLVQVDGPASSVQMPGGFSYSGIQSSYVYTFTEIGTFYYMCGQHGIFGMRGEVHVIHDEPATATPTATMTLTPTSTPAATPTSTRVVRPLVRAYLPMAIGPA